MVYKNLKYQMIALRYKLGKTQEDIGNILNFKSHYPIVRIEKGRGTKNKTKEKILNIIKKNGFNELELVKLGKRINNNYEEYKRYNLPLIFKNLRRKLKLSQTELCKSLGIHQPVLASYESNKSTPRKYLLFKLNLVLKKNKIKKSVLFKKNRFENEGFRIDKNIIPKRSHRLTKYKVRIIAHCMFDGSVNLTKSNGAYEIGYCNKNKILINQFQNDISKVYGFKNAKIKYNNKKVPHMSYRSKEAYLDLLKYTPSYSTKEKNCKIPSVILNSPKEYKAIFLRAFFDDEGWCCIYKGGKADQYYIHRKSYIGGGCKNHNIRKQLIRLLREFGIIAYDNPYDGKILIKHKNILKFKKTINFTKGVKAQGDSTYWKGIEKRVILNKLIKLAGWDKNEYITK